MRGAEVGGEVGEVRRRVYGENAKTVCVVPTFRHFFLRQLSELYMSTVSTTTHDGLFAIPTGKCRDLAGSKERWKDDEVWRST